MARITKLELLQERDTTYQQPPQKRCATCKHFWHFGEYYQIVPAQPQRFKKVDPAGVCDLWKSH